jgi:hypothetical protein
MSCFVRRAEIRLLLVALALASCPVSELFAAAPREIILSDCLVLPPAGRSGRSPVHLDAVEALLVSGKWQAPKVGDTVALPDGKTRTWAAATAKDGAVGHAALQGG